MLSIVVPVLNESEIIPDLYARIESIASTWNEDYEVIVINDGSTDTTASILGALTKANPRWKSVDFSRNFGHQTAVSAGLHYAAGDAVIIIDADLQDPPETIGTLIDKWREGYQVVYAVRRKRKENLLKRLAYSGFYRFLRRMAAVEIPLDSGDFCLMDRVVVDVLNSMPERTRFVRGLRSWAGFRQIGVEYERAARAAGRPKYTIRKLFRLAFDGLFSFSSLPLRWASYLGLLVFGTGLFLGSFILVWWAIDFTIFGMTPRAAAGWTSIVTLILFLSGIQLIMTGIVGEYLARVFDEVKARPHWVISNTCGIPSEPKPTASKKQTCKLNAQQGVPAPVQSNGHSGEPCS